ncbi:hypothetical protein D3C81_2023150 [compost metagenome]
MRGDHAQGHLAGREILVTRGLGRCEIRAKVEQVVLDTGEHGTVRRFRQRADGEADGAVRLVHRADRFHACGILGQAGAVDQAGRAVVTGAGVDLVETDQGGIL